MFNTQQHRHNLLPTQSNWEVDRKIAETIDRAQRVRESQQRLMALKTNDQKALDNSHKAVLDKGSCNAGKDRTRRHQ